MRIQGENWDEAPVSWTCEHKKRRSLPFWLLLLLQRRSTLQGKRKPGGKGKRGKEREATLKGKKGKGRELRGKSWNP